MNNLFDRLEDGVLDALDFEFLNHVQGSTPGSTVMPSNWKRRSLRRSRRTSHSSH
jgi:hypothetical protein